MEVFMGSICAFAFGFVPDNFVGCYGQQLSQSQYTALWTMLNGIYGAASPNSFYAPNLMGRAALCYGQGEKTDIYKLGETAGGTTMVISANNTPAHSHEMIFSMEGGFTGDSQTPQNNYPATADNTLENYYCLTATPDTYMGPKLMASELSYAGSLSGSATVTLSCQRPYLTISYCMATTTHFPPRS